jgi:NADPH-dependent 2,4-dienoyl-CoA reductase/sulfur reductase-like enzyme
LLLATGADPVKLTLPGADKPHVYTLRSLADSQAIIAAATAKPAAQAVVIGASFIGLEVAASLRARGLTVHVVAPGARPLEHVLGPELGDFIRGLHEEHGVQFHLGRKPAAFEDGVVVLDDGSRLPADLDGRRCRRAALHRARREGRVESRPGRPRRRVPRDECARASTRRGDIARWPDAATGERLRIEHWVVAERQGQTAARNMVGRREVFRTVPFFWSQHYDVSINYIGHAESWDRIEVVGDIAARNALVAYRRAGRIAAIATVFRDRESLEAEALFEREDHEGLDRLVQR